MSNACQICKLKRFCHVMSICLIKRTNWNLEMSKWVCREKSIDFKWKAKTKFLLSKIWISCWRSEIYLQQIMLQVESLQSNVHWLKDKRWQKKSIKSTTLAYKKNEISSKGAANKLSNLSYFTSVESEKWLIQLKIHWIQVVNKRPEPTVNSSLHQPLKSCARVLVCMVILLQTQQEP